MLDIDTQAPAGGSSPTLESVEFFRIELAPLADGRIFVSLTATVVDEQEPQLIDQEIVCDRIATLDELLALIRAHVRIRAPAH